VGNIGNPDAGTPHSGAVVARYRLDDPVAGNIALNSTQARFKQPRENVELVVHRTGGMQGNVSVQYNTFDRDAHEGRDYTAVSGQLDWSDGDSSDRMISIPILDAGLPPGTRRDFGVRLTPVTSDIALGIGATAVEIYTPVTTGPADGGRSGGGGGAFDVWLALALLPAFLLRTKRTD
jgi:hypothetical protein